MWGANLHAHWETEVASTLDFMQLNQEIEAASTFCKQGTCTLYYGQFILQQGSPERSRSAQDARCRCFKRQSKKSTADTVNGFSYHDNRS